MEVGTTLGSIIVSQSIVGLLTHWAETPLTINCYWSVNGSIIYACPTLSQHTSHYQGWPWMTLIETFKVIFKVIFELAMVDLPIPGTNMNELRRRLGGLTRWERPCWAMLKVFGLRKFMIINTPCKGIPWRGNPMTSKASINCMGNTMLVYRPIVYMGNGFRYFFTVSMATVHGLWRHIWTQRGRFTY